MKAFRQQLEAIGSALLIIEKLPEETVWSLTCTNDDDATSPSVLNIFALEVEWPIIITQLRLKNPVDESGPNGDQFLSYRQGSLHISIIDQETP